MSFDSTGVKNPKKAVKIASIVLVALLLLMVGGYAVSLFVEYIQIKEIGGQFTSNFWINFNVKILSQGASLFIIFLMFYITNLFLKKVILTRHPDWYVLKRQWIWILFSAVIAFIGSSMVRDGIYSQYLLFANASEFHIEDPLFDQDIGYYMFSRPFMMALVKSLTGIAGFITVYTLAVYFFFEADAKPANIRPALRNRKVFLHNFINIAIWGVLVAFSYKFKKEGLLFNSFSDLAGAGYTDVKVWALFYNVMPYLFLAVLMFTIVFLLKRKYKFAVISVAVLPAAFLIAAGADAVLNALVVAPNELGVQSEYMAYNIDMTRKAYGLDQIESRDFELDDSLTAADIEEHASTIDNVRITDFEATKTALNKLQTIKPYYSFVDSDMVPYRINGKNTMLSVAARELDKDKLAQTTDTYVNNVFKYTHGYGAVVNPVNQVTTEGQPHFAIRDIPIITEEGMPKITQPRIYYGEITNDHVIVNSKMGELDYSEEEGYSYTGEGGIELNFANRAIFSILYGDYKMLISDQITSDSRILPNRNILKRVKMVAPFLQYDTDPYLIVDGSGRLKWIIDAYTMADSFPYAQKITGTDVNYVRNSIKVVLDAYDGTPKFYVVDESDPIAQTYRKIYPDMFEEGAIPEDINSHIIYPEKLFNIQSQMYRRYHITDVNVFYSQQDLWEVAKEKDYQSATKDIAAYYNMMQIEGLSDGEEQMILTLPFTLKNRDYLSAWLAVGSDSTNYGKMIVYQFKYNNDDKAYGTLQIENRIDNDPQISSEMTLWGQGGSTVIRGNMLVVPIKNSLLYIEPVYLTTNNEASFPELKRIIVAYGDKISMQPSLREALAVIFGTVEDTQEPNEPANPNQPTQPTTPGTDEELNKLIELYGQYKTYNAQNDYEAAGRVMKEIDELISSLSGGTQ
jgi:uncharacterized membrane protein (UPF0182 family)